MSEQRNAVSQSAGQARAAPEACHSQCCQVGIAIVDLKNDLHKHIDDKTKELEEMIKSGFPHGDPKSHRSVHEKYIEEAEERAALRKTVIERTVTGVVWAGIVFVAIAIWEYIKGAAKS